MSWANCGTDSKGRPIGYSVEATCDQPGCDCKIDRGLSFACGGMHGETELGCERYFCADHLTTLVDDGTGYTSVCEECAQELRASGDWVFDDEDGNLVRAGL